MNAPLSRAELDVLYPRFHQLIGGYFNQDWYDEYDGSVQAALADYIAPFEVHELERTAVEIDTLLAKYGDDQLEQILERLDNNYMYKEDGGYTARTWLEAIRAHLRGG